MEHACKQSRVKNGMAEMANRLYHRLHRIIQNSAILICTLVRMGLVQRSICSNLGGLGANKYASRTDIMRAWVGTAGISRRSCLIYAICRDASRDYRSTCISPTENRFDSRNSTLPLSVSLFSLHSSSTFVVGVQRERAPHRAVGRSISS